MKCLTRWKTAPTTALTIASTSIRQDEHGRFCLNDLHKASGGADVHKPTFWARTDVTKDLIAEVSKVADMQLCPLEAKAGRYGGTYAVKELVYAYAMWVSPKFHLAVIRAYDQMVTQGRQAAAAPSHDLSTMPRSQMLDHFQLLLTHARDAEAKRVHLVREASSAGMSCWATPLVACRRLARNSAKATLTKAPPITDEKTMKICPSPMAN